MFPSPLSSSRRLPLFHGYAHGRELPSAADPVGYSVGFVFATGLLHVIGIGIGVIADRPRGRVVVRALGIVIACIGVVLHVERGARMNGTLPALLIAAAFGIAIASAHAQVRWNSLVVFVVTGASGRIRDDSARVERTRSSRGPGSRSVSCSVSVHLAKALEIPRRNCARHDGWRDWRRSRQRCTRTRVDRAARVCRVDNVPRGACRGPTRAARAESRFKLAHRRSRCSRRPCRCCRSLPATCPITSNRSVDMIASARFARTLCALLALAPLAHAHDFWLQPQDFRIDANAPAAVHAAGRPRDRFASGSPIPARRIERFDVVAPGGSTYDVHSRLPPWWRSR